MTAAAADDAARQAAAATAIDPREVADEAEPPELDGRTGVPKVLKAYVVHAEPKITVVPHFLSGAEVDHLLELAEAYWVPSVVGTGVYRTNDEAQDLTNKPSMNRTSYSCMLRSAQTPRVLSIEHRLAHLAGIEVEYLERLNMVRYAPGQLFNRHHDGRFRPKTVFIYLNDLPEGDGGETLFPELGVKVVPRKGCAVMWANNMRPGVEDPRTAHQGLPPRTATKFGVNCFFNDKPLKQWEDVDSDIGEEEGQLAVPKTPAAERWQTVDPRTLLEGAGAASEPLSPGQIRAFNVCQDPRLSIVPGFLTQSEAAALVACLGPPEARAACPDDVFVRIEQRMSVLAGLPVAYMDPLRVAKCEPNMTPDGQVLARGQYGKRFGRKVVHVFLNDVLEGGELRFPRLRLQVRPCEGCAVVWATVREGGEEDPRAAHQGRAPREGTRYCALGVFRDKPVRGVLE